MDLQVLISIFLFGICSTEAFHSLIPEGKELVFEYKGTISASTHIPRPYASYFSLHGNLHVQRDDQNVFAKFSDLEYKLYNGLDLDDELNSKIFPIPEQVEDFTKAFRIEYQPTGNIAGIATRKDEPQYAVNFKKGISSMLQLDLETLIKNDNHDVYVFQTTESTIFGKGLVDYTVNVNKDSYHINVMHEPQSMRHLYANFLGNVEYESPMSDFDEPLSRDSQRSYVLTKVGNDKIIDSIQHNGGIYNTPFNAQGEAHVIYVNQTLDLKSTKPITSKIEVETEVYHDELTYHIADLDNVELKLPDVTNGRRKLDKEAMVENAITLIKELIDYVVEIEIDATKPDFKRGQILISLSGVMLSFDEKMFDKMHDKLRETNDLLQLNIYHQMLTKLGTHAAYRHLIKLSNEKQIRYESFVYNMFANVKFPNKNLVEDMAQILKLDNKPVINGLATLSFGTLLGKAVKRNKRYNSVNSDFSPGSKFAENYPDAKYYEKYVVELVSKLKEAKTYPEQIIYLQALHNTRMESVVQHLLPAVNGEWWKDYHLRMMSALAIAPMVTRNAEMTFKIYWPFLINSGIPTSFRILSYHMIMKSKPNLARLSNIYWLMHSMKNHELYTFHYQYIKAISESENPHNRKFIVHLRQIMKYTLKPVLRGLTGYYHFDYYNEAYSFGEEMNLMTIHSKNENDLVIAGSYKSTANRLTERPYWVFMRISGFQPSFLKALKLDTTSKTFRFTWENLINALFSLGKSDEAKITFIVALNGNTIMAQAFDKDSVADILASFKSLTTADKINDGGISINYKLAETTILPTEMGFPVICFNYIPNIDQTYALMTRENSDSEIKFTFDILYKSLTNSRRGLSYYNPFLGVFQGVSKLHSLEQTFNLTFNASIDSAQRTLKVLWTKHETPNEEFFAERSYTESVVYVLDDSKTGVLQKSNSDCRNFEIITLGEEFKTNYTIQRLPLSVIGTYFNEFAFDVEEPLPKELDSNVELDSDNYFKSIIYSIRFEELQPKEINYGIFRTFQVNEFNPVDKIEMTLKLDTEYQKGNNYLYPDVTHKMKFHFVAGTENETYRDWTANAKLHMDDGHMNNIFSLQFASFDGEHAFCIKGDSIWTNGDLKSDPDFKSTVYISANILEGEMCVKGNSLLTFEIHGEKSEEQKESDYPYHSCQEDVKGLIDNEKSLECLFEYDSLRKYTFSLKHYFPKEKHVRPESIFNEIAPKLSSDSESIHPIDGVKSNEIRTIFYLPMRPADSLKFRVYSEDTGTSYEVSNQLETGINTVYGSMFEFLHDFGLTEVCVIDNQKRKIMNALGKEVECAMSEDWSLFLATTETAPKFEILMKSTSGNGFALKFIFKTHTLEIEPTDKTYYFKVDGENMKDERLSFTNNWLYYAWVRDTDIVSIYIKNIGVHVIYNGYQASIEYPQIEGVDMHGKCSN